MNPILTLVVLAVGASVDAGDLAVIAEHAGGFSNRVQWRLRIANSHVSVHASDAARSGAFDITNEQRRQFIALVDEARFFALKAQYGMGTMEANVCGMTVSLGAQKGTVTLLVYSRRKPPSESESLELQRAYRVWDALKVLGRLADVPDDCREKLDIWEMPPR